MPLRGPRIQWQQLRGLASSAAVGRSILIDPYSNYTEVVQSKADPNVSIYRTDKTVVSGEKEVYGLYHDFHNFMPHGRSWLDRVLEGLARPMKSPLHPLYLNGFIKVRFRSKITVMTSSLDALPPIIVNSFMHFTRSLIRVDW